MSKLADPTGLLLKRVADAVKNGKPVNVAGLSFKNAITPDIDLRDANLTHTDLSGVKARESYFVRADLTDAILKDADLEGSSLVGATLRGVHAHSVSLREARLEYADLAGASLRYADLAGADLLGANLSYADLTGANLAGAKLNNACLRGARLSRARFAHARLTGVDFTHADLYDADLLGANWDGMVFSAPRIGVVMCYPTPYGWMCQRLGHAQPVDEFITCTPYLIPLLAEEETAVWDGLVAAVRALEASAPDAAETLASIHNYTTCAREEEEEEEGE